MTRSFVIADPHFGHEGVCQFNNGTLRPWDTAAEMDEALIDNWNSVVRPRDRVYVLGDLCMGRRHIPTVGRCNGRKVLVKGNHDVWKLRDYLPYFDDIRAYVVKPSSRIIMSHIPIHPQQLERWRANIHGHLHSRKIEDPRYVCVSVEQIDFTPVDLQEILNTLPQSEQEH